MSPDISLLPEQLRGQEEELKRQPAPKTSEKPAMAIPPSEEEMDVVEVDEGELNEVLAGEPLLSRTLFGVQSFFENAKTSLFHPRTVEPPPKLPPQFFKPRVPSKPPGLVPIGSAMEPPRPEIPTGPRIVPAAETPRRVRVIKRVRKPVHVSFLDEAEMELRADIPRRRFTLVLMTAVFVAMVGGGYELLNRQGAKAAEHLGAVQQQVSGIQKRIAERQSEWASYQDLEARLRILGGILDRHVVPTRLFDALEQLTVPDVSYSALTLAANGTVTLSASARSFESAARQVVALRRSGIAQSVDAFGYQATYDQKTGLPAQVNFQVTMALNANTLNAGSATSTTR